MTIILRFKTATEIIQVTQINENKNKIVKMLRKINQTLGTMESTIRIIKK
jgi:hypothetical protein